MDEEIPYIHYFQKKMNITVCPFSEGVHIPLLYDGLLHNRHLINA